MAYHHDLLRHAKELAEKDPANSTQADLRRAVSAAYYAVFHLLISETLAHWNLEGSRAGLARMFEHGMMAKASARVLDSKAFPYVGEDPVVVRKLKTIAEAFRELQDARHEADYNNAKVWTQGEAIDEVWNAIIAVIEWEAIRDEKIAQDYLVSLLIKPRR